MSALLAAPSKNAIQKTLAAELLSTAGVGDPISFDDVDGIQNKPGVLVIDRVDSGGTATPSKREYIEYSGTSGTTVLITARNADSSSSAQTHAVGAIVEFIPDVVWANRIYDGLSQVINPSDLSLSIHSSGATITAITDDPTMATASATTLATSESVKEFVNGANGVQALTTVASAVNKVTVTNAATGGNVKVAATGDDTNINLELLGKGTGQVIQTVNRQGGNATNWSSLGTTNYTAKALIQCGANDVPGSSTKDITFPVAFSERPLVVLTPYSASSVTNMTVSNSGYSASQFTVRNNDTSARGFFWIAIGPSEN
jgi:hypothetical protein